MTIDRTQLRLAYRMDEDACIAERLAQAAPASEVHDRAKTIAAQLIEGARARKASGLDAFLQAYGLGTEEGIALMCLAEALLRVPDAATADALIHDKLAGIDWSEHFGTSGSTFVNAATFSLMLTGQVLHQRKAGGFGAALKRAVGRLGEPVIRQAVLQAMKILGGQFVFGRTIEEALDNARGQAHSFDMLGEAAMTFADAERYRLSYSAALDRIAAEASGGVASSPGISVKLSALSRTSLSRRAMPTSTSPSTPRKPSGSSFRWTSSQRWSPMTNCLQAAGRASASRCKPIRSARCRWPNG
jgi:RHH-type proline utilization regulon transcriptional repressor/proline dehydrogenase/delta 1-pyrroline-5-carboxylate dehydrogenase